MSKDFYLGLIPVGDYCYWRGILNDIAMTTTLHDKAYRCWRYFDELEAKKYIDDEPVFFPNEHIKLEGNINFRIAISAPIYYSDNDRKNNRMVATPWRDEDMNYKEASWLGVNKIINDHSEYVLIVKRDCGLLSEHYEERNEFLKRVIDICEKASRKYKVIADDEKL
jgi:hypothetical protein